MCLMTLLHVITNSAFHRNHLRLPYVRTNLFQTNVRYIGAVVWNYLDKHFVRNCATESFRKRLNYFFIQIQ